MLKKGLVILVALSFCIGIFSCGSSNNAKAVCEAIADTLYEACDPSNPADQATLVAAFATLGETYTTDEIANLSESEAVSECTASFDDDGVEITDEVKDTALTAINAIPTTDCATAAYGLVGLLNAI